MRFKSIILTAGICIMPFVSPELQAQNAGGILGVVADRDTGIPLVGAIVIILTTAE